MSNTKPTNDKNTINKKATPATEFATKGDNTLKKTNKKPGTLSGRK